MTQPVSGFTGWVGSALSTARCGFAQNPVVSFGRIAAQPNLIGGITITWCASMGEMARDFTVCAWLGNTPVAERKIEGNTKITNAVEMNIHNYDHITVEVT